MIIYNYKRRGSLIGKITCAHIMEVQHNEI